MSNPTPHSSINHKRREHCVWLETYARWRSEHRQALMMLAKIQTTILQRDAALENQAAEIQAHEQHLQDYEVVEYGPGSPDRTQLETESTTFENRHQHAREIFDITKKKHVNLVDEVQKLFNFCHAGR